MRKLATLALLPSFVLYGQQLDSSKGFDRVGPGSSAAIALQGGERPSRWALMLEGQPLAELVQDRRQIAAAALGDAGRQLFARQDRVKSELQRRGLRITAATHTLLNAVFVSATAEEAQALSAIPGVLRVVELRRLKRHDVKAVDLVNAAQGWTVVGGEESAGAGVRIGIIDSGIDHTHPAFDDPALRPPAGFPKCRPEDCAYTNNKVIVARSYVEISAVPDSPNLSRPDDYSPRDRVGHGTAAATIAAGRRTRGRSADVIGAAPKAFLGNYKIYGSPGVNDFPYGDVLAVALEDAFNDGMDVVSMSFGAAADYPHDARLCGSDDRQPCDPDALAVESAIRRGMAVVVSAGNDADSGLLAPALGSITTPGIVPSAITVGASTNSHLFFSTVRPIGGGVPSDIREIDAQLTNGLKPAGPITAKLVDVTSLANDGKACTPLGNGSMTGSIALIQRGDCEFLDKIRHAQQAGAIAVIIYQRDGTNALFPISQIAEAGIPAVMIGNTPGTKLKDLLRTAPETQVTIDPELVEIQAREFDTVAYFSSAGPSISGFGIKPELVAPGTDMYMGTQNYDPNGDMYSPNRYFAAQGTSFAAPMVAGAVAVVKQRSPRATVSQLKSAVVNTANPEIDDFDANDNRFRARVVTVGAGKLNLDAAVRSTIAADPATVSLGVVRSTGGLPSTGLTLSNFGSSSVTLALSVVQDDADSRARVTLSNTSVTLAAGASSLITVRLDGTTPSPGQYQGTIRITGGPVALRVPYLYAVGDNVPYNAFPLRGNLFTKTPDSEIRGINFKAVDRYGVPVDNVRMDFQRGTGTIVDATGATDGWGIGQINVARTGSTVGPQEFSVTIGSLKLFFDGRNRLLPTIRAGGVVNAASGQVGQGFAPGSYISIFGSGLSDSLQVFKTPYLPLSLSSVSVSFDVESRRTSYPGRIHFVSDSQINVQIPWELEGLTSCLMKVSIGNIQSALYTVPLNTAGPAAFEYTESSGRLMAAALDEAYRVVGSANPVERGKVLQIYANGLGPVANPQKSGEAATAISSTRSTPEVTIGGQAAQVLYSGVAPGSAGLYQLNVIVPTGAPTGIQPVVIRIDGVASKPASTVVR